MITGCSTLVLDLDGTISDPSQGITRCFNYALQKQGFEQLNDVIIAKEIGPPLDVSFKKLAQCNQAQTIALVASHRERYAEVGYSENILYPKIFETLTNLKNCNLRLGVCTSKRVDFAEKILDMFGLSDFFEFVDGGEIGISKGQQLAVLLEAQQIDRQAIMIGDRNVDILAAKQNQLSSIGVLWGFGDNQELTTAGADHIVGSMSELTALFN